MDVVIGGYRNIMDNKSDPRVNGWFLMSSPFPTLAICLSYFYFVKVLGPIIMKNKKPYELRRVLIYYNICQVLISIWLFYESIMSGWFTGYNFKCQPMDYSNNPKALRMAHACWWYFMSKFVEFFDTIFFVVRKKQNQVTTLHVIHHGIMPMSVWFGVKFSPGGHSTFFALLNTFVHIIMYSYYLVSALGPKFKRYLWWKKYLTSIQMVQFLIVMVHEFQLLVIDCNYPRASVLFAAMHAVLFYFLFLNFYKQNYLEKRAMPKVVNKSGMFDYLNYMTLTKKVTNFINNNANNNVVNSDKQGNIKEESNFAVDGTTRQRTVIS